MPSDCHSEFAIFWAMSVYKLAVHATDLLSFGILSSLFTRAAALIFHRLLMRWLCLFAFVLPFITAHGYGLFLKAILAT